MQVSSGRPGWSCGLFVGGLHARGVLIRASEGLEGARGMDVSGDTLGWTIEDVTAWEGRVLWRGR